jgi:hypothetical protein
VVKGLSGEAEVSREAEAAVELVTRLWASPRRGPTPPAAERQTLMEALTRKRPRIHSMRNGAITIECGREHLDGFASYAELADAIEKWLEETSRQ